MEKLQEVDEFIIGLPKSSDGEETPQSNKVRSVAGRLAVRAAERYKLLCFFKCYLLVSDLHQISLYSLFRLQIVGIVLFGSIVNVKCSIVLKM